MKFSIGVQISRFSPEKPLEQAAREAVEVLQLADELGFEIAWAGEHQGHEFFAGPNPMIQLMQWHFLTTRIRLGTAVLVAPYWHPLRMASEIGMTDFLTGGRLEVGIARGAYQFEFDRMLRGMPQEQGREYVFENVDAAIKLWQGDYEHHGKYFDFPAATSVPKPVQKPHPPLWIAARDPQTFDFAVKRGINIMSTPHRLPISEVVNLRGKLDSALANNPGARRPRWMVSRMACVYEDQKEWMIPVEAMLEYTRIFMPLFDNRTPVINGFVQRGEIPEHDQRGDYRPEALRENMMFGTPDEVVAKLKQYEAIGVDVFSYNSTWGLPHEVEMRSMRLFAEHVMPHFRDDRSRTNGALAATRAEPAPAR
jgi:alkanesulfonate monooxygenase SsuD/methylene tetrahydromethanopterin reductase-like flavin-dependent oxidoreductase (luciferase family)